MSAARDIIRRQRRKKRRSPARRPRWRVVLAALAAATAVTGTAWAARELVLAPWMRVRTISVRGAVRLTEADVRMALADVLGQPLLLLDLDRARARLQRSPGIREARLARRPPDGIEAVLLERRAVARAVVGGRDQLVDADGYLFSAFHAQPGDAQLPELRGLVTQPGEPRLSPLDRPGVDALMVLARVLGGPPPEGVTVDLTPKDRIVLRPGHDAPTLWLDRARPDFNIKNLYAWQDRALEIAPGSSVDLRFAHRLTVTPPPPPDETTGAAME